MQTKLFICLLGLVLISLAFTCTHEPTTQINGKSAFTEYYSSIPLRESPYPRWRGIIRLSKAQAQVRNHYRFVYDEQFRLHKITFQLGDHLQEPNHTANYFFTAPEIRFSYRDNLEIRTFFDRFGQATTSRGAFREVYTMDNQGRYQSLHFENQQGQKVENDWGISEYRWKVKNDGSVIEKRFNLKSEPKSLRPGFDFYTIRLTYEENGMLALMQNIDESGALVENRSGVAQDKLHFDQAGRWLGWTVLDAQHKVKRGNGPNVAKGINRTNEWGYEVGIHYEDEKGKRVKNAYGFWGSKRFYDQHGNYDYTQFIDQNGQVGINDKAAYSIAQYHWSEDGLRRLKVDLLDIQRKKVLHKTRGYASVKLDYDQESRHIKTSYLGLDGRPINRQDNGVAYLEYLYDKQNKVVATKRFDKEGKKIP